IRRSLSAVPPGVCPGARGRAPISVQSPQPSGFDPTRYSWIALLLDLAVDRSPRHFALANAALVRPPWRPYALRFISVTGCGRHPRHLSRLRSATRARSYATRREVRPAIEMRQHVPQARAATRHPCFPFKPTGYAARDARAQPVVCVVLFGLVSL